MPVINHQTSGYSMQCNLFKAIQLVSYWMAMPMIMICCVTVESSQLIMTENKNSQNSDTDGSNVSVMTNAILAVLLVVSLICIIVLIIFVCKLKVQHQTPDKDNR